MGGSVTKIDIVQPGKYYQVTTKICGYGNGSVCDGNTYPSTFYATISGVDENGAVLSVSVFTGGNGYRTGDIFYLFDGNSNRTKQEDYCIVRATEVTKS